MKKARLKRFLILGGLFCAVALYLRYRQAGTIIDESQLCARFESAVNDVLAKHGVTDAQIGASVRQERKKTWPVPTLWVETERQVRVPSEKLSGILREVRKTGMAMKLDTFRESDEKGKTALEAGKGGRIYQRLIFAPAAGRRAAKARVAIVIDDVAGRPTDLEKLEEFFSVGVPITFAILPLERQSRATADKIHGAGHEIILHQPMEPSNLAQNNPGKAAILTGMRAGEVQDRIRENLATVPHAVGVSNHMGSKYTSEEKAMKALFVSLHKLNRKDHSLYFFDSHTTPKIVSDKLARQAKFPYLSNDVFLDGQDELNFILKQLDQTRRHALRHGSAAAIGHVQRKHMAAALKKAAAEFRKDGIEFVHLSELIK